MSFSCFFLKKIGWLKNKFCDVAAAAAAVAVVVGCVSDGVVLMI
jgi:hypothetical protein